MLAGKAIDYSVDGHSARKKMQVSYLGKALEVKYETRSNHTDQIFQAVSAKKEGLLPLPNEYVSSA